MQVNKTSFDPTYSKINVNRKNPETSSLSEQGDTVDIKQGESQEGGFIQKTKDFCKKAGNAIASVPGKVSEFYQTKIKGGYDNLDYRTKFKIKGAAIGGAAGAVAGFVAGELQNSKNVVITRTYPVPETYSKDMGQIPKDFYQNDWSGWDHGPDSHAHDHAPNGWRNIYETSPRLDAEGHPVMKDVTETIESKRYGRFSATILGAAIGTVAGFLGSIAIDVIKHFDEA